MPLFVVKDYPKKQVLPAIIAAKELPRLRGVFGARIGDAFVSPRTPDGLFLHEICTWRPVWKDGTQEEAELLERCYLQALELAAQKGYQTVAVPLLAREDCSFPRKLQYDIATKVIRTFLDEQEMTVYLVAPDFCGGDPRLLQEVRQLVEGTCMDPSAVTPTPYIPREEAGWVEREYLSDAVTTVILPPMDIPAPCPPPAAKKKVGLPLPSWDIAPKKAPGPKPIPPAPKKSSSAIPPAPPSISVGALPDLADLVRKTDASFSKTLLRLIDESGRKDSDVYNRANVSRQHFSKIRNNSHYRPTKATALAFAIALELDMDQTEDLIRRAGYTLSESLVFDVVIMYFIQKRHYNLFDINEALFEFDQALLGA